ncbi:hypothetical protein BsWGS_06144 [Bradybaena similaris]
MASTMAGQSCRLLNLISGIRNLKLSLIHQSGVNGLSRQLWTGSIFGAGSKQAVQDSKNVHTKPKMPANVFVTFVLQVAEDLKKKNPDIKQTELFKQASLMWQELDPEEKSRLAVERRELYDKYKEDMKTYLDNMTPEQIQEEELKKERRTARRLKSLKKQLGTPKKPLGSFSYFLSEHYPERSGEPAASTFKALMSKWMEMSDEEKEKYKQKSRESSKQYKEDIIKWEKEMIALGRFDLVRKSVLSQLNKTKSKKPVKKKTVGFSAHEDDTEH